MEHQWNKIGGMDLRFTHCVNPIEEYSCQEYSSIGMKGKNLRLKVAKAKNGGPIRKIFLSLSLGGCACASNPAEKPFISVSNVMGPSTLQLISIREIKTLFLPRLLTPSFHVSSTVFVSHGSKQHGEYGGNTCATRRN